MSMVRENVRLLDEDYPRKHEEVKENGYDAACSQDPFTPSADFVHRTISWFNDQFYEFSAEGRCACGSTFQVKDAGPGTHEGVEIRVTLNTLHLTPCTAILPTVERAVLRVRENLGRPSVCGNCCGATVREDGKTTGWGRREGEICRPCDGTGQRPAWSHRAPLLGLSYDEKALRSVALGLVDKIVDTCEKADEKNRESMRARGYTHGASQTTRDVLADLVLWLRRKLWDAEVEFGRAESEKPE